VKKKTYSLESHEEVRQKIIEDPDLLEIFSKRVESRLFSLWSELLKRLPKGLKTDMDKAQGEKRAEYQERVNTLLGTFRSEIVEKEVVRFRNELLKYGKRYGTSYFDDIKQARKGNRRKLLRLVEWDKAWNMIKPIQEKLFFAQENGDFDFIREFGEALQKQSGCSSKPKEKEIIKSLQAFADRYSDKIKHPDFIKGMHDFLQDKDIVGEGKDDPDYFIKWLKRHNVIS